MLRDEFAPKPARVKVSAVPRELCLPTEKVVAGGTFKILNPVMHLLCFSVSRTPVVPKVWDQNQFGTSAIRVLKTNWLCLPSFKRVVPPTP